MTESENNCKCTGQVEKVIVRIPGPQGGKGETGPQGELNPADKEFIAQKAQEATEAATGAENAKNKAEESRIAAKASQKAAEASQIAAKSSKDAAAESAAQAKGSEGAAGNSATVAANAESGARTAASAAAVSAGEAEKASGVAGQAKADAVAAKDAAETAQTGAESSAASAKGSADKAAAALKDTQAEKTDALAKIDATVTQAKSDIQAQVTVATTQATTATQAATTATQKSTEADQSAKDAEASKVSAEAAKASAEASANTATEQAGIATEKAEALTEAMDNLTTLSNDAVRFTAQEKTDAEKYQARKNIAASSAGEVEALKKQVANLQAQAEGKTFTYETDATEAYSKDVPDGAYPYAAVKSFGGKTIVWNQLCTLRETNIAEISGISFELNRGKGTVHIKGTATARVFTYVANFLDAVNANSKVLISYGLGKFPAGVIGTVTDNSNNENTFQNIPALSVQTVKITSKNFLLYLEIAAGTNIDLTLCPMCFNLTAMFSAGNEPTSEEFIQMFSNDYYGYSTGELKSAPINNLRNIGKNLIKNSGEITINSQQYFNFPSKIQKNTKLLLTAHVQLVSDTSVVNTTVVLQNKSTEIAYGNLPLTIGKHSVLLAPTSDVDRLCIYAAGGYANSQGKTLVLKELQLERGSTATDYSPYKEENRAIPQAVLNLEGYGWSAGTAKNWVDLERKEYHREVASVDLGSKSWWFNPESATNKQRFTCYANGTKINTVSDGVSNLLTCPYVTDSWTNIVTNADKDKIISAVMDSGNSYIAVRDSAYTDATAFKESLKGTLLYYELAEPEIIDISDILPDDNIFGVEEGGTITFENSNGDGFRISVPSEIVYQKKVTTNE